MKRTIRSPFPLSVPVLALVLVLGLAATACGDSSDEPSDAGTTDTDTSADEVPPEDGSDGTDGTVGSDAADPAEAAAPLVPTATFPIEGGELINSLAVSPDGTLLAVAMQDGLGDPITIRIHDATTGEAGAETTFDAVGIGRLLWMGDDRIVALSDVDMVWRSWDGATLEASPDLPFEFDCRASAVDRIAGYAYSIVEDDTAVCRTDTRTGEMIRSGGDIVDVESIWARPGTSEVLAINYPDPEATPDLVSLAGADLAAGETTSLAFGDQVRAVGTTTWIDYFEPRVSLLEPGAVPAPDIRDSIQASTAGDYFVSSNGNNDNIVFSAADGSVVGSLAAAWNPSLFSDWSTDDAVMVRLGLDYGVERYEF